MSNEIINTPIGFNVLGNLIPLIFLNLNDTTMFTKTNTTMTTLTATTIDGKSLKGIRMVPSW